MVNKNNISNIRNFYDLMIENLNLDNLLSSPSIVHPGFPGTFNLSFTEYDMINLFGNYVDVTQNISIKRRVEVIRPAEIKKEIDNYLFWKNHLTFFTIIGNSIYCMEENKRIFYEEIEKLLSFLSKTLDIADGLKIVVPADGEFIKRYGNNKYILKSISDVNLERIIKKYGIKIKKEISSKTILTPVLFGKDSPWGYRLEIMYNDTEICTIEELKWRFSIKEKRIIPLESRVYIWAIGFERLWMVKNKEDFIWNFYLSSEYQEVYKILIGLLPLIIIYDFQDYEEYSRHRKEKIRLFEKKLKNSMVEFNDINIMKLIEDISYFYENIFDRKINKNKIIYNIKNRGIINE